MKRTLTLKPAPARLPPPIVADPQKIALSVMLGLRYISRGGRYIQQAYVQLENHVDIEHTWIDVPLVPEVYG